MQTLTEIRSLLASRGIRPKHRLGQNFLHDHQILRRLVDTAEVAQAMVVLEVGPGTGALTELLLERGASVIACEIDRDMLAILRERVEPRADGRLTLVDGDCLDGKRTLSQVLRTALAGRPFRLVANLPYGSATPLIATLLSDHPECDGLFATIQREVADRLLASTRSDAYGPLSVTTALLARGERVMDVSPGCFWPAPEVTSAIVALRPRPISERPDALRHAAGVHDFARFVMSVFSKRRKQLGSILGRQAPLPPDVGATQRPEELSPIQWFELWRLHAVVTERRNDDQHPPGAVSAPMDGDRPSR